MFSTKSAQSLKKLFGGYHEPPSISKQQSQKLLDGLKTSFRTQLDREYGRSLESTPHKALTKPASAVVARRSAAHQHVKSILSNPLFGYNKPSAPTTPSSIAASKRDPMDVFEHAVAKGMMTLRAATGCLIAKRQRIAESDEDAISSDTALHILRWLRSSGAENSLRFLDHEPFIDALMPFMIVEGKESVAWEWVTSTMTNTTGDINDEQRIRRSSLVLSNLVRIQSRSEYGNLNAAISTILEAEQRFKQHPLLSDLLVQPWRSVSWFSTVEASTLSAPSEELFDAHMATASRLHRQVSVETAHLHLHHPTHPDYRPALSFFGDMSSLRKMVHEIQPVKVDWKAPNEMGLVPWITFLGRDTVDYLKQTGHAQEAHGLSAMLQSELAGMFKGSLKPA